MPRTFVILIALGAVLGFDQAASGTDSVPFQSVDVWRPAGVAKQARAGRHVIRSREELRDSGVDRLIPRGLRIDFQREMLVAVVGDGLGEIVDIRRGAERTASRAGTRFQLAPGHGWDYHVVKLARYPGPDAWWSSTTSVRSGPTFERVARRRITPILLTGSVANDVEDVLVFRDGRVKVRVGPDGASTLHHGHATAPQLAALEAAAAGARLHRVPPVGTFVVDDTRTLLRVVSWRGDSRVRHGTRLPSGTRDRLRPLHSILDAIVRQVTPPQPLFHQVGLRVPDLEVEIDNRGAVRVVPDGGTPLSGWATRAELGALDRRVRVNSLSDGIHSGRHADRSFALRISGAGPAGPDESPQPGPAVEQAEAIARRLLERHKDPLRSVSRTVHDAQGTRVRIEVDRSGRAVLTNTPKDDLLWSPARVGQATPKELADLRSAVARASMDDLPWTLGGTAGSPFELVLTTPGGEASEIRGRIGSYGRWAQRMDPVMKALDTISQRLLRSRVVVVEGRVETWAGSVQLRVGKRPVGVFASNELKAVLSGLKGERVRLQGTLTHDGPPVTLNATALLSPTPIEVQAEAWLVHGTLHTRFLPGRRDLPLSGPGKKALWGQLRWDRPLDSRWLVSLVGYGFHQAGKLTKVHATGVRATVRRDTPFRTDPSAPGLKRGESVLITRYYSSKSVSVRTPDGRGGQVDPRALEVNRRRPSASTLGAKSRTSPTSGAIGGLR